MCGYHFCIPHLSHHGVHHALDVFPLASPDGTTTGGFAVLTGGAHANDLVVLSPSSEDPNNPTPLAQLPVSEQFQYLVYFCGRVNPTNLMTGNKQQDESRGIHHFLLGSQKGLVKNIELQNESQIRSYII